MDTLSINKVASRNILRGLIHKNDHNATIKAINKIKRLNNVNDLKNAILVLNKSPLFEENKIIREFNKNFTHDLNEVLGFTIKEIIKRINENKETLKKLLTTAEIIQQHISNVEYTDAIKSCKDLINENGVSWHLARTLTFIKNRLDTENYLSEIESIEDILEKIEVKNLEKLHNILNQIENPKTDYFILCKQVSEIQPKKPYDFIAKNFIDSNTTPENFKNLANSYYSLSILDALIFFLSSEKDNVSTSQLTSNIDSELRSIFNKIYSIEANTTTFKEHQEDGIELLRCSYLLKEICEYNIYRSTICTLYNDNEKKFIAISLHERNLINSYFKKIKNLECISSSQKKQTGLCINEYHQSKSSIIENSCALLFYLEKNENFIIDQEEQFIRLMTFTSDLSTIIPESYLKKMYENAKNNKLKLIISCLIFAKKNSMQNEHELRHVVQKLIAEDYNNDFINLLEDTHDISPAVSEHLINICDETFLTKLFNITETPNAAIENRAEILEWYGKKTGDINLIKQAKNLRIDIQINKEKGTIDDSRIYVDINKFTQWINDNVINQLTLLIEDIDSQESTTNIIWDFSGSKFRPLDQMAHILLQCYKTFCENNIFGIASYLGRRIRHGTFLGTALTSIKDISQDPDYNLLFSDKDFKSQYEEWVKNYEQLMTNIKDKNLHINNKRKPDGLIHSTLNTPNKRTIATNLLTTILAKSDETEIRVKIPYIITEFCWRIIDEDLISIRKFLIEKTQKNAIFKYHKNNNSSISQTNISKFNKHLNHITGEKFRIIAAWFDKPSFASPSTEISLLFNAILSEIRELHTSFNPEVEKVISPITIKGGQYFAIYDALYILIFNAAKHGKPDGQISLKNELLEDIKTIKFTLNSEIQINDDMIKIKSRIEGYLNDNFSGAHVTEGESGIKKLRQMEKDEYIKNINYKFSEKNIEAEFGIKYEPL